ncbi:unnamed protein product [Rhizoctonia solani]|uniref:Uncharacterized protein n=1 Tax=Rhizoctonia solani TaxID=456999 RepID=A0A8H3HEN0_9AGAM|nr:unnamed protein product [Rhizoctonia solani]
MNAYHVYPLLNPGEDKSSSQIPWLERFATFLQRADAETRWDFEGGEGVNPWAVCLFINGHSLEFVGYGTSKKEAKVNLIKQLQDSDVLTLPLRPEFQVRSYPRP